MADTTLDPSLSTSQPTQGDVRTEEMLVNMGPQHPSTHGVLRVVLRADGELILEAVPHIGYLHRCAEKIGENVAPYQYIPYTDRMDYLAGMNNNQAFALAVEKLAGLEVPERALYIRTIFRRAEPHRLPPGRGGYLRAGHGRVHAVSVLLPRAGDDPRSV
jgi:NADH:ubiquinone oxidoreductase subunit D